MNTKLLMTASAVSLAVIGLGLTFFATEIAGYSLPGSSVALQLGIQVLGALYFAFALLNWMAKESVIGGIYNRPIVLANVAHYLIGGLALVKGLLKHPELPTLLWMVAGWYVVFALFFGRVFFRSPVAKKELTPVHG